MSPKPRFKKRGSPQKDSPLSAPPPHTALDLPLPEKKENLPHILFVTNSLRAGGAETHILALVKGLRQRGYFVAVASAGGEMESELAALDTPHIYAPLDSRLPHHILASRRILKKAVKDYDIQILHSHSRLASLACRLLGHSRNRRFVATAHLDFSVGPITRRLGFWGEKTLAVSEDIRGYLIREYKLSYENIALTVNGIDTDRFSPAENDLRDSTLSQEGAFDETKAAQTPASSEHAAENTFVREENTAENAVTAEKGRALRPSGEKILLHVSRIDKDRAYTAFLLCDLIGLLNERYGIKLVILGGGELFDKLQKKAEAVNRLYGPIVSLAGPVKDIVPYLKKTSLFVGVSRAALEAMSCGIPTILSGNSGYMGIFRAPLLTEAAKTNFCCRGSAPATRSALLSDIDTLLKASPEELARIAAECRNTVTEHYSLDKMVCDYLALYDSLRPFSRKKRSDTLIVGYHGYGNLGDVAILSEMIKALREKDPERSITVLSGDPRKTEATHAVRAISRRNPAILSALFSAKTVYVGGGTVLQEETSRRSLLYYVLLLRLARIGGASVAYWANGMSPYRSAMQPLVARLMQGKTVITLRDVQSQDLLYSLTGEKTPYCQVTADSGFLTPPCDASRLFAICEEQGLRRFALFVPNGSIRRKDYPAILARAARRAAEKGDRPVLLLMQPSLDKKVAGRTVAFAKKQLGLNLPVLTPSHQEARALIGSAAFVLSSRLHSLIFAASAGVPAISFGTGDKCRLFAEELFGKEYALSADKDGENELNYAITALYEEKDKLREQIARRAAPLKEAAAQTPILLEEALAALSAEREAAEAAKEKKGIRSKRKVRTVTEKERPRRKREEKPTVSSAEDCFDLPKESCRFVNQQLLHEKLPSEQGRAEPSDFSQDNRAADGGASDKTPSHSPAITNSTPATGRNGWWRKKKLSSRPTTR